eukprot:849930_1
MGVYSQNDNIIHDCKAVDLCMEYYLHFISNHDTLYDKLATLCTKNQDCNRFRRTHRIGDLANGTCSTLGVEETVNRQIIDKIHCYFAHGYSMGYRVAEKENASDGIKHSNNRLKTLTQTNNNELSFQLKKFSRGFSNNPTNDSNVIKPNPDDLCYSFGFNFDYGSKWHKNSEQNISSKKHKNMKSEMMAVMPRWRFDAEYSKAKRHYDSCHGKKYVADHIHEYDTLKHLDPEIRQTLSGMVKTTQFPYGVDRFETVKLSTEHLLAVMIYCNFSNICEAFSKTFRAVSPSESKESVFTKHSEYYWFGKHLKELVHYFGTAVVDDRSFYHGVDKQMKFPRMMIAGYNYVAMFGPLSTSSEYAVAE